MRRCREATIEDPKAKHYVNILLSSVEYETFVKLMRIMKPVAAQQRNGVKAEAKREASSDEKPSSGNPTSPSKMSKVEADAESERLEGAKRISDHPPAEAKITSDSAPDKDGK